MQAVNCPVQGFHEHEKWCFANRAITKHDHDEAVRRGEPTYQRVFNDHDEARQFKFDQRIRG